MFLKGWCSIYKERPPVLSICLLVITVATIAITYSQPLQAQSNLGGFFRSGVGARPLGMGGAYVAIAEGGSAAFWNPAGLAKLEGIQLGSMYTNKFSQQVPFHSLSMSAGFNLKGIPLSVAISPNQSKVKLSRMGLGASMTGMKTGNYYGGKWFGEKRSLSLATLSFGFNGKGNLRGNFSLGANFKKYYRRETGVKARGYGMDIGFLMSRKLSRLPVSVGLGGSFQDIGSPALTRFESSKVVGKILSYNRVGMAIEFKDWLLVAVDYDFSLSHSNLNSIHLGTEVNFYNIFRLRGGLKRWSQGQGIDFTIGGSLKLDTLQISYAFLPHKTLGSTNILSAKVTLGPLWTIV